MARTPTAGVGIALKPRRADAPLDLAPVVAELRLVERLPALLADDDVGARWRGHAAIVQGVGTTWVPDSTMMACGYRIGYQTD